MINGRLATTQSAWHTSLYEFGQYLHDRRQQVLHLSQADIAACVSLNQSAISRIESGHKPRDKATALAIAEAYRLSPAETRLWLELLFGVPTTPIADGAPWGDAFEHVYDLLERAGAKIPPPIFT